MIDGLRLIERITDFEAWKQAVKIELFTPTDKDTGAIKEKGRHINGNLQSTITHRGEFETYQVKIKETILTRMDGSRSISYLLFVDGSLHKNHFDGKNYLPLEWNSLQTEIAKLETRLQLSPDIAELVNLEVGINIILPFQVFSFLQKNLIGYKGHPFNRYTPDKNGNCLGYVCPLSQYSVKVYDKAAQFNLEYNLMRFELRYLKMQPLKERGIKTLADLKNRERVRGLLSLLLTAWDNVLLYDLETIPGTLKDRDRNLLEHGSNPKFWERLKKDNARKFNYQRSKFRELQNKHGPGWHEKIKELIKTEWDNLFKNCTNLPGVQNRNLSDLLIKIKDKNVQKRYCLSCGLDISNQNSRSKFCSANFVGEKEAHRCRNKDSNPRNNFKNKLKRINGKGVLFDVLPFIVNYNKKQDYAI